MKNVFSRLFLVHWPRKVVAFVAAIVIWLLVSQTITTTRILPDVAIHIINLPPDKTIIGLLPNGLLNRRIAITLTGRRAFIDELRADDVEIVINAAGHKESWIATIDKRNLIALNPTTNLGKNITEVTANDFFIKLSRLITEDVPLVIMQPRGNPPKGYQLIDVWPKHLTQKVTGPEEYVRALKVNGLELTFNLDHISVQELNSLYTLQGKRDEVSFKVPDTWKFVSIPFQDNSIEPLDDPRAEFLRIDFLKQEFIPVTQELPITIFFPIIYSATLNPQFYSLATNSLIQKKNGLKLLSMPLFVRDVSHLFVEIVRNNLLLVIVAQPPSVKTSLDWTLEFIDAKLLEDNFVQAAFKQATGHYTEEGIHLSEETVRTRFREYCRTFTLVDGQGHPLALTAQIQGTTIILEQRQ